MLNACCHCDPPYPDCFGCLVFEPTEGGISDMEVEIGDTITWGSVEYAECTVPIQNWTGGRNCQLWGPEFGGSCGTLLRSGSGDARYHSVSPEYFSGVNTLQKNPAGTCIWKKRRVKLLQQVYHHSAFRQGSYPGSFLVNVCSEAEDTITYPYSDPVDANDMWSPLVFPKPAISARTGLPAIDTRCGTLIDPLLSIFGYNESTTWLCRDWSVQATLTLQISKLKVFSGIGGYVCRNGQTVFATDGDYYWELLLDVHRVATFVPCVVDMMDGFGMIAGAKRGVVTPYQSYNLSFDVRDPSVDLAACPPYGKVTDGTWCSSRGNVAPGGFTTVLRWTKPVDCDNDFNGDPIELTLDSPRRHVDSGDGDCECMDYELNATKLGMTGYNTTAIVNPIYV